MQTSSRPSLYQANLRKLCRLQQVSSLLDVARGRMFFHNHKESSSSDKETRHMPRMPWLQSNLSDSGSISERRG